MRRGAPIAAAALRCASSTPSQRCPTQTLVFAELCHGCGSCTLQCPAGAISERRSFVGRVTLGLGPGLRLGEGELQVGEAMPRR